MIHFQHTRRWSLAALLLALMGTVLAACGGPSDAVNAAVVNGQAIPMTQYQAETRLIDAVTHISDPTVPTWQNTTGRATLAQAQQRVLSLLITNMVLRSYLKINPTTLKKQEDAKLAQLFSQIPPQYKALADQGILTKETYRPFVEEQILDNDLEQNLKITTAHIRILTVKTKAQADALLKQLQGGANWATTAAKYSIDGAQGAGGDIPTLVPYFLPPQIDQVVFAPASINPNTIQEVHSSLGWSLVQVVSRTPNVPWSTLDNTVPVIPTSQVGVQSAALIGDINHLSSQAHIAVNANWCNNASGAQCPPLYPASQV
jgi:parvulin-like peptidyl-prolyl isomerase